MGISNFNNSGFASANRKPINNNRNFIGFGGGNLASGSIVAAARTMYTGSAAADGDAPIFGGTLTIGGNSLGNYEYKSFSGKTIVGSETFFSSTANNISSWITFSGDTIINVAANITPGVQKLFTCIYVNGNLTLNGTVDMDSKAAYHSGLVSSASIAIASGTYSSVVNPNVPANGGSGVGRRNGDGQPSGSAGGSSTNGGTGAGGNGGTWGGDGSTGATSNGSSFGGTSGSGGARDSSSGDVGQGAGPSGGAGGGSTTGGGPGGGVIFIIVEGTLTGSGIATANGSGSSGGNATGGGAGGGSVTVLCGTNSSTLTVRANGGSGGGSANGRQGGTGGTGTSRILTGLTKS
jgi:hypothetical protein